MDGLGHSDNTAVTCLEVEGERTRTVFENDNSHLPDEISTLARQRWWKGRDGTSGDANLWFRPLNLKKEGTVYRTARRCPSTGTRSRGTPCAAGNGPQSGR